MVFRTCAVGLIAASLLIAPPTFAQADDAKEKQAMARELLEMMDFGQLISETEKAMMQLLEQQLRGRPGIDERAISIVQNAVGDEFRLMLEPMLNLSVKVWQEYFDVEDFRTLVAFYKTPTGRKAIRAMPEIMRNVMLSTQALVRESQPRLTRRITEDLRKAGYDI